MSSELAHQPCQNIANLFISRVLAKFLPRRNYNKPKIAGNFVTGPSRWGCGRIGPHWGPGAEPCTPELLGFQ